MINKVFEFVCSKIPTDNFDYSYVQTSTRSFIYEYIINKKDDKIAAAFGHQQVEYIYQPARNVLAAQDLFHVELATGTSLPLLFLSKLHHHNVFPLSFVFI